MKSYLTAVLLSACIGESVSRYRDVAFRRLRQRDGGSGNSMFLASLPNCMFTTNC
jgi:hypothetical protein